MDSLCIFVVWLVFGLSNYRFALRSYKNLPFSFSFQLLINLELWKGEEVENRQSEVILNPIPCYLHNHLHIEF